MALPALAAPLAWNLLRQGAMWAGRALLGRGAQQAATGAAVTAGAAAVHEMTNGANDEIDQTLAPADATQACATCARNNPCRHLAAGAPGGPYRGGAYGTLAANGGHRHHTPAKAVSPLPHAIGPALQMDTADHMMTASHPASGGDYLGYQAAQASLIASGNFMGAVMMDVADIQSKFPGKYDVALAQMVAYAECLKQNGVVQ
ncbi:hypothetical protein CDO87_09440 [Sagittula sp. P11]|uniref:hypothetical protein n=1 Tax=Sagittula sp. P11 TaxID=2009329 RepID=UPI000C2CEF89|nr:hypothetical protein [Sagittula sp. P11]AUC53404.1 hypothetical protein CDO87_09440 [Sagittula sp. P11]